MGGGNNHSLGSISLRLSYEIISLSRKMGGEWTEQGSDSYSWWIERMKLRLPAINARIRNYIYIQKAISSETDPFIYLCTIASP